MEIILNKSNIEAGYLKRMNNGGFLAGRNKHHATYFTTAQDCYDHYRLVYDITNDHFAFNICYHVEDFI